MKLHNIWMKSLFLILKTIDLNLNLDFCKFSLN